MDQNYREALLKEYGEVSSNFRLLTDIRFKLLAFLPIATAAAVMKPDNLGILNIVFYIFGLGVTIGLAIYNARNDQLYDELIGRAAEIERSLGLTEGAFANRPRPWLTVSLLGKKLKIDHRTGVGIIYISSIALWLFGAYFSILKLGRRSYFSELGNNSVETGWTFLMAFAITLLSTFLVLNSIKNQRTIRQKRMRELAESAMYRLSSLELNEAAKDSEFIKTCAELAELDSDTIRVRAKFYGSLDKNSMNHYMPSESIMQAKSHFIALLTDLPPRWISDCAVHRRETTKPANIN
jgi:hypothetical protein